MKRSRALHCILGGLFTAVSLTLPGAMQAAQAQATPSPIRFIVPLGPGSGGDLLVRYVADRLGKISGRPTFVENRPGGDQVVAVQSLLSSPPDGSSLMLISSAAVVINPLLTKNMSFAAEQDIRPLVSAVTVTAAYVVAADSPFKRMEDVFSALRREPKSVSLGTYSLNWEAGVALLEDMTKVRFNFIPYKGVAQMTVDVIGGTLGVGVMDVGSALPLVRSGKARVLAVSGSAAHPDLPTVPPMRDSGAANYEYLPWLGFGINAKTPEPLAQAIEAQLTKIVMEPDFQAFASRTGAFSVSRNTGGKLLALVAADRERIGKLVRDGTFTTR
ncbi:tripartite-type tricarboxylate transporter receptor subunit TctC [Variovorax boronicumulans]|uniref:tripartite tricarboxylate transporter substrate binding protein n=1 Tax=Variovorax boronicumulans TaxID=436515 RepID=UPI002784CB86|nr:tripartite tricarboxylate transporter substrate binding protein [Variovorax boronicumulans]MDP9917419.1 tripartite-type tricarboxylate transporter receptor subunit TctC [Variovorax boronicumulans]